MAARGGCGRRPIGEVGGATEFVSLRAGGGEARCVLVVPIREAPVLAQFQGGIPRGRRGQLFEMLRAAGPAAPPP